MAVDHDGGVPGYEFQALRNLPHGYQRGPFDPGDLIFPGLAAVDEKRLLFMAVYHLGQRLRLTLHHIIHRRSAPLLRDRFENRGLATDPALPRLRGRRPLSPRRARLLFGRLRALSAVEAWSVGFHARRWASVDARDSICSIREAASRGRLASLPRRLRSTVDVQDTFSQIRAVGFQAPPAAQAGQPCAPAS